jgi:hypothetical protein
MRVSSHVVTPILNVTRPVGGPDAAAFWVYKRDFQPSSPRGNQVDIGLLTEAHRTSAALPQNKSTEMPSTHAREAPGFDWRRYPVRPPDARPYEVPELPGLHIPDARVRWRD